MGAISGAGTGLVGRVGDDAMGRRAREFWSSCGVDLRTLVLDADAPTGLYVNELGSDAAHRFDYHRGGSAGSRLAPDDLPPAGDPAWACATLHMSGIGVAVSETSADALAAARERARAAGAGISFSVNHRPRLGVARSCLLEHVRVADVVFVSDEEARELVGTDDAVDAAAALAPGAHEVVVTRGRRGADLVAHGSSSRRSPPRSSSSSTPPGRAMRWPVAYLAARSNGATAVHG